MLPQSSTNCKVTSGLSPRQSMASMARNRPRAARDSMPDMVKLLPVPVWPNMSMVAAPRSPRPTPTARRRACRRYRRRNTRRTPPWRGSASASRASASCRRACRSCAPRSVTLSIDTSSQPPRSNSYLKIGRLWTAMETPLAPRSWIWPPALSAWFEPSFRCGKRWRCCAMSALKIAPSVGLVRGVLCLLPATLPLLPLALHGQRRGFALGGPRRAAPRLRGAPRAVGRRE